MHCMAYYIFRKSLRRLEEFRKNPHIKIPPKSPCTNFQSLGKFKNPIFILKRISLQILAQSAQPHHRSVGPFGPCSPPRPLLPLSPMPAKHRLLLTCHHAMAAAPPSSHAMERPQWLPPSITLPPLQSAVIVSLLHSSNGSIEDAIYRHRPTYPGHLRPPPDPIKACPHFDGAPHTFTLSPPFLSHARIIVSWSQSSTASAPPPCCHPSSGERSPNRATSPSSCCHHRGKPTWPEVAARPSSSEPLLRPYLRSTVDRCRPWSTSV
jgi:hypothetical protein